jgi:AraC-like DNA-binding protein/predicted transcriptional regulator YdeE
MRGVAHIEHTIETSTSLEDIASIVALSEFHFHRQFRAYFGVPVMDYVRRRRLALAAKALLASPAPVLRIALAAGFESQAAFTRAFRKVFHTTPARFRRHGCEVPWLSCVPISSEVLAMLPGLGTEQPRIEVIGDIAVAGLTATIDVSERERIPRLWNELAAVVGPDRFARAEHFGVSAGDEKVLAGAFGYWAALSLDPATRPDARLERRTIPGSTYLVFHLVGGAPLIAAAYDYIGATWLPGSRHRLRPGPSFTRQREPDAAGRPAAIEIWIAVEAG